MTLSDRALTTVEAVEHELQIEHWSDTRIEGWVEAASELIAEYLGRQCYRDSGIVEKHRGDGWPHMILDRPPINSITSIEYLDSALAATDYEIDDADAGVVYFVGNPKVWSAYTGEGGARDPVPGTERKVYEVTYDGGWVTPGQSANSASDFFGDAVTLPKPIQRACILAVVDMRSRAGVSPDIQSESALSYSVTYKGTSDSLDSYGLPAHVCAMLRPWKFEEP